MEDSQKQNLVLAFTNVLRTSSLAGSVDIQRASMAFSTYLADVVDAPVALEPLYAYLLDQGAPEPAVREVIVFLKSRESRFGIALDLPPALAALSADDQQKIVAGFAQRGTTSGTYAGRAVPAATPPTAPPKDKGAEPFGKKKGDPPKRTPVLAGVLVVLVLVLIGSLVANELTRDPPPAAVNLDPAGLPCDQPVVSKGTVICRVSVAGFLKKNSPEAIAAKGAITKASALAIGAQRVLVLGVEDSKAYHSF